MSTSTSASRGCTVIRGGQILSMDPTVGDVTNGSILVRDGDIVAVGNEIEAPEGAEVIDASEAIVLPGFVDTHWHLWNSSMRAFIVADRPDMSYMPVTVALGPNFLPEDTYDASRLALAEALRSGITTVHDWSHNVRGPEYADASLRALVDAGVRGRFSYGWAQRSDLTKPMDVAGISEIQQEWFADPSRHRAMLSLGVASRNLVPGQSPRGAISVDLAHQDWDAARDLGVPITLHASPAGLVTMLEREHLLGDDVLMVHPMLLTAQECQTCASRGVTWSASAAGEIGRGPEQKIRFYELEQAGVPVGLSIDASSAGHANYFEVMRAMYASNSSRLGPDTGVTYRRMLELATIEGARVLGIDSVTGSITPGKRADIVLVDRTAVNMSPQGEAVTQVTNFAQPANVRTVMVDGRVLVRDWRSTVSDDQELCERATASAHAIAARAGWGS